MNKSAEFKFYLLNEPFFCLHGETCIYIFKLDCWLRDRTRQGNRKWKERGDGVGRGGEPENNDNNNTTVKTVRVTSYVNSDGTMTTTTHTMDTTLWLAKSCVEGYTDTVLYPGRNPRHWAKTSNPAAPAAPSALPREEMSPKSDESPPGPVSPTVLHSPS